MAQHQRTGSPKAFRPGMLPQYLWRQTEWPAKAHLLTITAKYFPSPLHSLYEWQSLLNAGGYILVGCLLLLFIVATVVLKAWCIANENPVKSIKSE
jgi:hypothetical protein